jgi:mRNA interferase HigB
VFLKLEHVGVLTWRVLREFAAKWPNAVTPLREWFKITERSKWRSFADVKATFGQTDQVKVKSGQSVCVFDIGGNKFRLIAFVSYNKSKVYVLRVMTHKEYDKGRWKADL